MAGQLLTIQTLSAKNGGWTTSGGGSERNLNDGNLFDDADEAAVEATEEAQEAEEEATEEAQEAEEEAAEEAQEAGEESAEEAQEESGGATATASESAANDCTQDFCESQVSPEFLLRYKVNVPEGMTLEGCGSDCTISYEAIYDGEAWVSIGFSTDGKMIGSEAVM